MADLPQKEARKRHRRPSIRALYGRTLTVIGAEVKAIAEQAWKGKLESAAAANLVAYTRLLSDLQKIEDRINEEVKKRMMNIPLEVLQQRARELLAKAIDVSTEPKTSSHGARAQSILGDNTRRRTRTRSAKKPPIP